MPDAPLILAFDTSAAHCAAALLSGDRVLAEAFEEMSRGQAERLMPLLEEVLRAGGAGWSDLCRIGVGIGPGNFTGIRISVSAARGLALGLGVPAIGVSSLEASAFGVKAPAVACIDARGGKLYLGIDGAIPILAEAGDLPPLPPGARCVGIAADALAAACGGTVTTPVMPLSQAIARIAATRAPGPRPAPLYIRAPDAAPAKPAPPVGPIGPTA